MSNDIRPGVEVVLADGKSRTVHPVSLRHLRKLNKVLKQLDAYENKDDSDEVDDKQIDLMVEAAGIALAKADPELAENSDELEDVVDIKTFSELIAAAMGTDPNVLGGIAKTP